MFDALSTEVQTYVVGLTTENAVSESITLSDIWWFSFNSISSPFIISINNTSSIINTNQNKNSEKSGRLYWNSNALEQPNLYTH